jgi:hypothetical protein
VRLGYRTETIKTIYKRLLFLPEDSGGFNTWCYATRGVRTDMIQKVLGWPKEMQLTTQEIKNKLLLTLDRFVNIDI